MPRHVERIVVVVESDRAGNESHTRYAELSDGERVRDPGFSGVGFSWPLFRRDEPGDDWGQLIGKKDLADPRRFRALSAALAEAGVNSMPNELAAVPLEVETVEVDRLPELVPTPQQLRYQRRSRIGLWVVAIVVGAFWPSWNRYRAWQRQSWRRRIFGGLGNWTLMTLVREAMRPRRRQG